MRDLAFSSHFCRRCCCCRYCATAPLTTVQLNRRWQRSAAHVTQRTISNSARALFIPLHLKGHHSRALLSSSTAAADDWLRAGHWHCVPLTVNCQFERRKSTVLRVRASVIGCCPCGRWFVGRYSTDRGRGGEQPYLHALTHIHSGAHCTLRLPLLGRPKSTLGSASAHLGK